MYLIEKIVTIFLQPSLKAFQCHVLQSNMISSSNHVMDGWETFLTFYASTFQTSITLNGKQKKLVHGSPTCHVPC
jgi:hypothetical protein